MVKCEDCQFGGTFRLFGPGLGTCMRLDDSECPNYNDETEEIEMGEENEKQVPAH